MNGENGCLALLLAEWDPLSEKGFLTTRQIKIARAKVLKWRKIFALFRARRQQPLFASRKLGVSGRSAVSPASQEEVPPQEPCREERDREKDARMKIRRENAGVCQDA